MDLVHKLAEAYAEQHSSPHDKLTEEVYQKTISLHPHAQMMSSRVQGKFLEIFSILVKPSRILEIGTFTGFSTLCLAKGLKPGGKLHTVELREEEARNSRAVFDRSNHAADIILHTGNALDIIPGLNENWDLVFIDADKPGYLDYYRMILPSVNSGGVILADNVLFHGEVLGETLKGKNAKAINSFNEYLDQEASVDHVLLTIRDGLMVIRKK